MTVDNKTYCEINWTPKFDQKKSQEAHFIVISVCLITIPACVVTLLYSAVILNLKRSRHTRGEGPSRYTMSERSREDKKANYFKRVSICQEEGGKINRNLCINGNEKLSSLQRA